MKNIQKYSINALMLSLAMSSAASAATLINAKGLTYQVKADWQLQLRQDTGSDQELDIEYDDFEIKNSIVYDLNNGVKAFGGLDMSFDKAADSEDRDFGAKLEEAFLGFKTSSTKVSFGATNSAGDEFGVEKAFEKVGIPEDGFEEIADKGDDLIRIDHKSGGLYIAASTELEAMGEGSNEKSFTDLYVSYKAAGFKVAGAVMSYKGSSTASTTDVTGISVNYKNYGFDFSTVDDGSADDLEIMNLSATFKAAPTTKIGVGINSAEQGSADVSGWYANATYQFPSQKNVSLVAEIGGNDADNVDAGFLLGMRIKL